MKIAIVGAGYAGLACCWHFLQKGMDVTVFYAGDGASHVSTGLLHSCPGKKAIPTRRAEEGISEAIQLLNIASRRAPVYVKNGILRFAQNEEQKTLFGGDTLWIEEGITVFSKMYLMGLKEACSQARFEHRWIENLEELDSFDRIVLTTGAESLAWADLPLKKTIGQSLICRWEKPLEMSLLGHGHITPTESKDFCLVGSTYEHTEKPDPKKALALIDQVAQFYPPAKDFKVEEIQVGTRISPKVGYLPLVQKINPKTWIFTGLGSRGLIYHALFAKEIDFG